MPLDFTKWFCQNIFFFQHKTIHLLDGPEGSAASWTWWGCQEEKWSEPGQTQGFLDYSDGAGIFSVDVRSFNCISPALLFYRLGEVSFVLVHLFVPWDHGRVCASLPLSQKSWKTAVLLKGFRWNGLDIFTYKCPKSQLHIHFRHTPYCFMLNIKTINILKLYSFVLSFLLFLSYEFTVRTETHYTLVQI